jgi:2-phospho-L-lactate transferase/gluconeogenesis factor (CofD/UPF0052 family)
MTKLGQTHGFKASDHVREITRYARRCPDVVVVHHGKFNSAILKKYHARGENVVEDDLKGYSQDFQIIRANLVTQKEQVRQEGDSLVRSLIRHDAKKLARVLYKVLINL